MFDRLCDDNTSLYRTDHGVAIRHEFDDGWLCCDGGLHLHAILPGEYSDQGVPVYVERMQSSECRELPESGANRNQLC